MTKSEFRGTYNRMGLLAAIILSLSLSTGVAYEGRTPDGHPCSVIIEDVDPHGSLRFKMTVPGLYPKYPVVLAFEWLANFPEQYHLTQSRLRLSILRKQKTGSDILTIRYLPNNRVQFFMFLGEKVETQLALSSCEITH